jgi:hypothetical protein
MPARSLNPPDETASQLLYGVWHDEVAGPHRNSPLWKSAHNAFVTTFEDVSSPETIRSSTQGGHTDLRQPSPSSC